MVTDSVHLKCAQCGYDRYGSTHTDVCPECGFVSAGERFEFGHTDSRWFLPVTTVGWLAVVSLQLAEASLWHSTGALLLLIGYYAWDMVAKRRRAKGMILVNATGFRVVNAAAPGGRWITWDKVVAVNKAGPVPIIFIAVRDPDPHQLQVGPMKNTRQRSEVIAAIARYYPEGNLAEDGPRNPEA